MITDGDDYAENKKNFFKILKFTPYGDVSLQAKPFVVEKKLLKTNQLFSAAQIGYITLLIKAYDENGKSDTAELKVLSFCYIYSLTGNIAFQLQMLVTFYIIIKYL